MDTKDAEVVSLNDRMDTKDAEVVSLNDRMDKTYGEVASLKRRIDSDESLPNKRPRTAENSVETFTSKMREKAIRATELQKKLLDCPDDSPKKVDDIYTNMVIQIGRKKDDFRGNRSENLCAYPKLSSVPIERAEELFVPMADTEDPKLILIRGRAGIGKTMFCQMLARDWAKDRLFRDEKNKSKIQFVFLFTFRQLNSIAKPLTLYDFLRISQTCPEMTNDILDYIIENPEKTLLIFDGFDEFRYRQEMWNERVDIVEVKMAVGTLVAKIAAGELLANATVVITSRPEAESDLKLEIQRGVEILGFDKDHVRRYADKFFNRINNDQKRLVLECILKDENIATFCYVPVNCFLVCMYMEWYLNENKGQVKAPLPSSLAELFLEVIKMFLLKHHKDCRGQENPNLSDGARNALDKLCQLSLELLKSKTFMFTDEDFEKYGIKKEEIHPLLSSGLVHCIPGCRTGPFSIKTYYCFLHLTLQEFLAACCLIKSDELIRFEQNNTDDLRNFSEMVLVFVAGLLGTIVRECGENIFGLKVTNENADKIMNFLVNKVYARVSLVVRVLYAYRKKQLVQNYSRLFYPGWGMKVDDVDSRICQAIAFFLMVEHENQPKMLWIRGHGKIDVSYIVEALKCENCQLTSLQVNALDLCFRDIQNINNVLTHSSGQLTELTLYGSRIGDKEAEHLSRGLTSPNCRLTKLHLEENEIADEGAEHFSRALTSPNCRLTNLSFRVNYIGKEGAKHLSRTLTSPNCRLTKLNINHNYVGDKGAKRFCRALRSPNCCLTKLCINANDMSNKGAKRFSRVLTNPNCRLTKLSIGFHCIGNKGAKHFSRALTSPNCRLTEFKFEEINIGNKGVKRLCRALTSPNCRLTKLVLEYNSIDDEGAAHFSDVLINPSCHITELFLCENKITDGGAEYISRALTSPNCGLTKLDLSNNHVGNKGAEHFSRALTSPNCRLTKLDLSGNCIDDEGAEHFSDELLANFVTL